ncbi:CaiB/BaiF CoA transferase family protein [Brevibacterium yomogidense]|uniref:CaiB/BaiF CoA transferase family protein n=1 Tax=Brevibacterium yomogidense TaxID=946573 RepID=UPI0018E06416|nr:CoA transferase [Brevibacterium yomogidense]
MTNGVDSRGGAPLEGVKVLEVGTVIMAPYAGKVLRDLGADVIKAEPPGGDIGRRIGILGPQGTSVLAMNLNAGKRSIVVDAQSPEGRHEMEALIGWADIVLTNTLPARRRRFGLDWEQVRAANPQAILVTGQGFASDSAHADTPAYDDIIQAASGLADTYRLRDGEPCYSPYVVADKVCGMTMAQSALAALHRRALDGEGCWVDVPMVDTMAAFTLVEHMGGSTFAPPDGPVGWSRVLAPEHRPHPTRDGWVCVMPYTDANWRRFCELIDRPDYLTHPQVATNRDRSADPTLYEQILAEYAATRTCARIEEECAARGIPAHRVTRVDDLVDGPYLGGRPVLTHARHTDEGDYVHVSGPAVFHGHDRPGPADSAMLDGDRAAILAMLDLDGPPHTAPPGGGR